MQITRWRRYGKDRLYVREDNGADIGWWDLVTGEGHCAEPSTMPQLQEAVREWRSERVADPQAAQAAATVATAPTPPPTGPTPSRGPTAVTLRPEPIPAPAPAPVTATDPVPFPIVRDLIYRPPGEELLPNIAAARAEGQRPTLLRRIVLGKDAYSTWERGAIGERLVWEELRKLDSRAGWGFLNSIPVGTNGSDIDHVVVGPAGVFTINAKYHDGARIWVGGDTILVNGAIRS
ncbi:Nuclease-related domain-containing protein [Raineyella antarctica]|uniref:Nuclease-related domain-containing protein n=1 Tax=Raineyella antarctica TaxID=1577474 RepID=A0A1G6IH47_9ACTN|nr:nuclease-related domain-containing protein [Raineyella antarctica]SDC05781.1 Nuclease-related domain-containing protein [Raineyella antarctica]